MSGSLAIGVRPAAPRDAAAIASIHVRAWQEAYRGLIPDAILDALSIDERTRQHEEAFARDPATFRWVAEKGDVVVGFALAGPTRDDASIGSKGDRVAELYAIYLEPTAVGSGVGRALFASVADALGSKGFAQLTLWVLPGNARARRFYEAAGMALDGAEKTETVRGVDLPHVRYRMGLGQR